MSRRRRRGVVALVGLSALAAGAAACQAAAGDANCQLVEPATTTLPGTPLTLLQNARLDQVGGQFFLLGSDGTSVRWGAVSTGGTLSGEQAYALPVGVSNPFFAMAGAETPGDTVLIGYLGTNPDQTDGELAIIAVPAAGGPPLAPAAAVLTFPNGVPDTSDLENLPVALISSRPGNNAGLAWRDSQTGLVQLATLDAQGAMVGDPVQASTDPGTGCLGFSSGKNDLTMSYYSSSVTTKSGTGAGWVVVEASEGGSVQLTTELMTGAPMGACALVAPTGAGYDLVWEDSQGSWLAVYDAQAASLTGPLEFASATVFGGASLQPPQAGAVVFGTDVGVLYDRPLDAELWRIDDTGTRKPGALEFPSVNGTFGGISALSFQGMMVATYADYLTLPGGATPATGSRWLVNAVCN